MLFYVSILSALDVKFEFLMNWVELTRFLVESSCVELKIWATQLESSWKCEQLDSILIQVQNVNLKLNSMISLFAIMKVTNKFYNLYAQYAELRLFVRYDAIDEFKVQEYKVKILNVLQHKLMHFWSNLCIIIDCFRSLYFNIIEKRFAYFKKILQYLDYDSDKLSNEVNDIL